MATHPQTTRGFTLIEVLVAISVMALMSLMAWRTTIGGLNAWSSGAGSMMLGFPEWIVYTGMVPPLALTAAIALAQSALGFPDEAETA